MKAFLKYLFRKLPKLKDLAYLDMSESRKGMYGYRKAVLMQIKRVYGGKER